jgi:AdoMet-dependent rRNA methyltransferase SPB1
MSESSKSESIAKLMRKAQRKVRTKKDKVQVVVARGRNKGQGRPSGVKGRYKMVDARMKKETRAMKRKSKKK